LIEAEKFDEGGEGVAYRDLTPGNDGGAYRTTNVDLESSTDTGGGYNVGWMAAGEWLQYSIDVTTSGTYVLDARVASNGTGGTFHVELDGANLSGPLAIPNTGGWQQWQSVTKSGVSLPAGQHRLRIVLDSDGPGGIFGNINYLGFSASPTAAPAEVVIYAADVPGLFGGWSKVAEPSAAGGVTLKTPDVGWATTDVPLASPANYIEATFAAVAAVPYRLWLRLRATDDTKFSESVWVQFSDGVNASGTPTYRIGTTHALLVNLENCFGCGVHGWGWQNRGYWLSDSGEIRFAASGQHVIRIQVREDGAWLDQIVLSPARFLSSPPGGLKDDTTIVTK
jgi:hypothetical protein